MKTALLLSGGLDSVALSWWKKPYLAYTIDYGQQSARGEVRASRAVCAALNIRHEILTVALGDLGSGDLAHRPAIDIAPSSDWWPFRNQLIVTFASCRAVEEGVECLLLGTVKEDSQHADGRLEFVLKMSALLAAQEGGLKLKAPAAKMTSIELVTVSRVPASILCWAHSCHTGEYSCGSCRGCRKHFNVTEALWGHGY